MTQEEYTNKVAELTEKFELDKQSLRREYALSNNPYKVGDIVTDHIGSIVIEKIQHTISITHQYPFCVYTGLELKKDGTPTKKESKRAVYQTNIKTI